MQPWFFSIGRLHLGQGFVLARIQFKFSLSALFLITHFFTVSQSTCIPAQHPCQIVEHLVICLAPFIQIAQLLNVLLGKKLEHQDDGMTAARERRTICALSPIGLLRCNHS